MPRRSWHAPIDQCGEGSEDLDVRHNERTANFQIAKNDISDLHSHSPFHCIVERPDRNSTNDPRMLPLPPLAGVAGMDLRLLYVQYLARDVHQNFNFLFRLR